MEKTWFCLIQSQVSNWCQTMGYLRHCTFLWTPPSRKPNGLSPWSWRFIGQISRACPERLHPRFQSLLHLGSSKIKAWICQKKNLPNWPNFLAITLNFKLPWIFTPKHPRNLSRPKPSHVQVPIWKNVELQWVLNIKQATHGSHLDKNILPPVAITRHVAQSEVAMCNLSRYNVYMYADS